MAMKRWIRPQYGEYDDHMIVGRYEERAQSSFKRTMPRSIVRRDVEDLD